MDKRLVWWNKRVGRQIDPLVDLKRMQANRGADTLLPRLFSPRPFPGGVSGGGGASGGGGTTNLPGAAAGAVPEVAAAATPTTPAIDYSMGWRPTNAMSQTAAPPPPSSAPAAANSYPFFKRFLRSPLESWTIWNYVGVVMMLLLFGMIIFAIFWLFRSSTSKPLPPAQAPSWANGNGDGSVTPSSAPNPTNTTTTTRPHFTPPSLFSASSTPGSDPASSNPFAPAAAAAAAGPPSSSAFSPYSQHLNFGKRGLSTEGLANLPTVATGQISGIGKPIRVTDILSLKRGWMNPIITVTGESEVLQIPGAVYRFTCNEISPGKAAVAQLPQVSSFPPDVQVTYQIINATNASHVHVVLAEGDRFYGSGEESERQVFGVADVATLKSDGERGWSL